MGEALHHPPPGRECANPNCRARFIPKRGSPQKYHSAKCAHEALVAIWRSNRVRNRRGERGFLKRCETCQRAFEAKRRHARFCGRPCRQKRKTEEVEKTCAVCREPFKTTRALRRKYCGKGCQDIARYDLKLKRAGKRRSSRRGSPALEKKRLEVQRAGKIAALSGESVAEVLARIRAGEASPPADPPAPPRRLPRLLELARLAFPRGRDA